MRALFLALIAVPTLSAQQPASDAIPRELALALIGGFGGQRTPPTIIVGRAPASIPAASLPPGVNVLGGTEHRRGSTAVFTTPESPDSARNTLVRHLERSGWRVADREWGQGFVPSPTEVPSLYCRNDEGMNVLVRERAQGGTLALLSIWNGPVQGPCDERERNRSGRVERPDLPTLEAPPGARMLGSGMGGGREGREAHARLESTMSTADIAAHYARQLTRAGWTVTGPAVAEGVAAYGVRHRDEENRPLGGALVVLDIPASQQRELLLRVAREERMP